MYIINDHRTMYNDIYERSVFFLFQPPFKKTEFHTNVLTLNLFHITPQIIHDKHSNTKTCLLYECIIHKCIRTYTFSICSVMHLVLQCSFIVPKWQGVTPILTLTRPNQISSLQNINVSIYLSINIFFYFSI